MGHFLLHRTWIGLATVFLMLSAAAIAGSADQQVSARIEATATVINPIGFADAGRRALSPTLEESAINSAEIHVSLAGNLLVRLPVGGSLLVQVELDGNPFSCVALTPSNIGLEGGSDLYADANSPLVAVPLGVSPQSFSADGNLCVVTLITTEN